MATTVFNFSNDNLKIRHREPLLTEGLNRKFLGVVPSGVYRGFRLTTSATPLAVDIAIDSVFSDNIAVITTSNGYSISVRKTSGFTVSLATSASSTVVIGITGTYTTSAPTTGQIKTYTTSEYEALSDANKALIVVLGTVIVPGSGTISSDSITHDRRNSAWERMAREANVPALLTKNASFELGEAGATGTFVVPFWENEITAGSATWRLTTTLANTGAKSIELNVASTAAPITGKLYQRFNTPVVTGQLLKVQLYLNILASATSGASSGQIFVEWGDSTGSVLSTSTGTLGIEGSAAGFTKVDHVFSVPTNATQVKRVGIVLTTVTYAATGVKFRVDDFNSFLETIDSKGIDASQTQISGIAAFPLLLADPTLDFTSISALLRYDGTENEVIGERSDQDSTAEPPTLRWKGVVTVGEDLIGDAATPLTPRITAEPSTFGGVDYTLMWESLPDSEKGMRFYVQPDGTCVQTQNCYWDGSDWNKDIVGETASKAAFSKNGVDLFIKSASLDTAWGDSVGASDWSNKYVSLDGSSLLNEITGRISLGEDLIGTLANAVLPRLRTNPAITAITDRTLLWDSGDGQSSGNRVNRIYVAPDGIFELTSNAYWNGTDWQSDDTAENSTKIYFDNATFDIYFQEATASSWNDSSWDKQELRIDAATDDNHLYGSLVLGENLLGSIADSLLPRLKLPNNSISSSRTLLLTTDSGDGSGDGTKSLLNIYAPSNTLGNYEFTVNAYHDGTNWNRTNITNSVASKYQFSNQAMSIFRQSSAGTDWSDSNWDNGGASVTISGQDNPAGALGFTNTLLNKNIPKAWANVTVGPTSAVTFNDSFNFSTSVTVLAASVEFSFASPMANNDYVIQVTCASSGDACIANVNSQTPDDFTLRFFNLNSSLTTPRDLTGANTAIFHITVFGAQ